MNRLPLMGLLAVLAACQTSSTLDEESPFALVPEGSSLILNRPITIPADSLKIFLQDGQLRPAVNQLYPFCKFELRDLDATPRTVEPDTFTITHTQRVTDWVVGREQKPAFARVRLSMLGGETFDNGGPSPVVYGTRMDLRSSRQLQVFRLTCGHLQDPNMTARHIPISQIRAALGDVFILRLPTQRP